MLKHNRFLIISFVEGASVMAAEISGARILAPFFGSSLHVWSSVMAITLAGLASGYFLGGKLSRRENRERILLYVLIAAACCLCSMTFMGRIFYLTGMYLPLIPAVVVSVFLLLFPAMLCMGATSPLIISILTKELSESGANSGKIYAVSTLGGILATFLCGFYLLPEFGVSATLIGFALAMALVSLLVFIRPYPRTPALMLLFVCGLTAYSFVRAPKNPYLVYEEEGILGRLEIREEPSRENASVMIRKLLINTIVQTEMNTDTKASVSEYVRLLEHNLDYFPKGKVLVLGLGGGVVANMLASHGYSVTGVEFDQRIIEMSKRFFYLDASVTPVCDDARHYINSASGKWKVILFDIFKAEEQPAHVITKESLEQLKSKLDTNAVVLINTHGYLNGTKGLGTQCMLATLKQAGFSLRICASSEDEAYRNLLIVASLKPLTGELHNELHSWTLSNHSVINEDDKPVMELLNAPANQEWRSNYIRNYILNR
jgi:predicted membrane-bound spermidine synthase